MPQFRYRAITSAGEIIVGEVDASSREEVMRRIEYLGHLAIDAEVAATGILTRSHRRTGKLPGSRGVGPRVLNYLGDSKVKAAKLQIESFSSSLDLFYLDVGRYPTGGEGLSALTQRPGNAAILERTLSQDRRGAFRSVGACVPLPLAW